MRILFFVGLIVLILGIASLFIPVPIREKHGVTAGNFSVGFETTRRRTVQPGVSAVIIGAGALLLVVGASGRKP